MGDEIGIHIRARANLEEVDAAARKLENFGGASVRVSSQVRQLVDSLKESAGTDVNNLAQEIDKLQKKMQQPGLSDRERKQAKGEIDDIRTKIKELKQLQKIKADDYGSMEQTARMYLDQLKNKRALTNAEKEHIKEVEKGLAYLEKYNKAKLDLEETHLNKIQQDLKQQDEEAKKAGLGGVGQYAKRFGRQAVGLVIGGSIVAVAVQAMKKWADLDTQITKSAMSLDGMSKISVEGITRIGNALGYTKEEALAYLDIITSISGKMNLTEAKGYGNLLEWGRAMGVGQTGLQMREMQRWGGEGVKPGQDKVFLSQFTAIARMLNMREGRMTEFIETAIELTKTMEKTFIQVDKQDIFRNILFPSMVFGGTDRGRGQRGLSFMQRMNEGMAGGGDLANLMMYRTIGVPQSWEQMWNLKKVREQGVFGTVEKGGEPLIMGLIQSYQNMFGSGARGMSAMKSAMPNMKTIEIEEMFKMKAGLDAGNWKMEVGKIDKDMQEKLAKQGIEYEKGFLTNLNMEKFNVLVKDYPKVVEDYSNRNNISAGERWKVAIENMQYSIGGIFGQTTISLLTGMATAVDALAVRFGKDSGYVSRKDEIIQSGMMYRKSVERGTENISQERLDEIQKELTAAYGKEPGEKGYRTISEMQKLEKEYNDKKALLNDEYFMLSLEFAEKYKIPQQEVASIASLAKTIAMNGKTGIPEIDNFVEEKQKLNKATTDDIFKSPSLFYGGIKEGIKDTFIQTDAEKAFEKYLNEMGYTGKDKTNAWNAAINSADVYRQTTNKDDKIPDDMNQIQQRINESITNMENKSHWGGFTDWLKMMKATGEANDLQAYIELMKPSQPNITNNYNISIDGEKVGYRVNPVTNEVTITPPDYLPPKDNAN